jgi:two-component system NarL family sensor kinase
MPPGWRALWSPQWGAAAVTALTVVGVVVAGRLTGRSMAVPIETSGPLTVLAAFSTALGVLVLAYLPRHVVGRLLTAAGVVATVEVVALSWSKAEPLAWLSQWAWWPSFTLTFLALLVFPDGRLPSRRWRPLAAVLVLTMVVGSAALAVAALDADGPEKLLVPGPPPAELSTVAGSALQVGVLAAALGLLALLGVLWSLWRRWRSADGDSRLQLACLLPAVVLLVLGIVLDSLHAPGAWALYAMALPVAMSVAVLRYHLWDLDRLVNRSLVWLLMTLLVIVGFVVLVAILRAAVITRGKDADTHASLVATGMIAITFDPLRHRVQRGVNRLLYGDRDDPYKVIAQLGDLLEHTADPTAVLPSLVDTMARSLQVPYVAIELEGQHGANVVASHGAPVTTAESFDMLTHGQRVGRLLVGTRTSGAHFVHRECQLLQNVAQHAAVAAEATRLISDLRDSRERLIVAQEEERRRLRRDLHDGVGPSLAGMSMQVRAARKVVMGQERVEQILANLDEDLRRCNAEMRVLVDRLRPPALDRGLEAALHGECARFDSTALTVRLDVSGSLEGLPAAVEVVAYRILSEALANVARHSQARTCWVTVVRDDMLVVVVQDDGIGLAHQVRRGVGLSSMQERAAEIGGTCQVTSADGSGARVEIRLPVSTAGEQRSAAHGAGSQGMESDEEHGAEPADSHRGRPSSGAARAALDAGG